jgi:hypothetical protein
MANERNIEALTEVLLESLPQPNVAAPALLAGVAKALAESLASRGVIVPTALTDDEAVKIGADAAGSLPAERSEIALCVRQAWRRLRGANGRPVPKKIHRRRDADPKEGVRRHLVL